MSWEDTCHSCLLYSFIACDTHYLEDHLTSAVLQLGYVRWGISYSAAPLTFFSSSPPCRRESMCCGVWLQVHWDLCGCPAQREGAVWGHRTAGPPSAGQQGEEWAAASLPKKEGEHPQESQALLGQDCGQKQQEYGFQAQVQILPWPLGALGTQSPPDVPLMDVIEGHWDW